MPEPEHDQEPEKLTPERQGLAMTNAVHEVIFRKGLAPGHPVVKRFTRETFVLFDGWNGGERGVVDLARLKELCDRAGVDLEALPDGDFCWDPRPPEKPTEDE